MYLTTVAFTCLIGIIVESADQNSYFNGQFEFYDLTHSFDNNTIYWPKAQKFAFTKSEENYRKSGGWWFAAKEFATAEHGGTHMDAPYHFDSSGSHIGDIPVDKLIVPMIIVDISSKVSDDPNFVLYKRHLDNSLNDNHGKPCVIIFKFGWSKYFNDRKKYLGLSENGDSLNFPGMNSEIAEWITTSFKNVVGVGVDTSSVDPGSSTDFPAHRIYAKNSLYLMENIKLVDKIPEIGCTAVAMPMKIAEGTGAPLRLVAVCPKHTSA